MILPEKVDIRNWKCDIGAKDARGIGTNCNHIFKMPPFQNLDSIFKKEGCIGKDGELYRTEKYFTGKLIKDYEETLEAFNEYHYYSHIFDNSAEALEHISYPHIIQRVKKYHNVREMSYCRAAFYGSEIEDILCNSKVQLVLSTYTQC